MINSLIDKKKYRISILQVDPHLKDRGGTIGSATAAYRCQGKCRSVVDVIKYDMTLAQQRKLIDSVRVALQSISTEDLVVLLPMVMNSAPLKAAALREIVKFMTNEMGMAISNS